MKTAPKPRKHDWSRFEAMSEAGRHAAALRDPDAQPLTAERLAHMKRTPQVKVIRRALGLSQEEFAERFQYRLALCATGNKVAKPPTRLRALILS
jgi:putative transcriptional regulator